MFKTTYLIVISLALLMFTACPPPEGGTNDGGNSGANGETTEKTVEAAVMETDDSFSKAFMRKDVDFFTTNITDDFVGQTGQGPMDKAVVLHWLKTNKCDVKDAPATERSVVEFGEGVALLTGMNSSEETCDGKTTKNSERYAVLWKKDGDAWKAVFYQGIPLTEDEKGDDAESADSADAANTNTAAAPASDTEAKKEESSAGEEKKEEAPAEPPKPNIANDAELAKTLIEQEKTLWEAFSKHETKLFEDLLADKAILLTAEGTRDKAAEVKFVEEHKCETKSWSLSDEKASKIGDNLVILTYKANQDTTCDGTKIPPVSYLSTILMKDGDTWKPIFHGTTPEQEM